jgi:hypothetical protein
MTVMDALPRKQAPKKDVPMIDSVGPVRTEHIFPSQTECGADLVQAARAGEWTATAMEPLRVDRRESRHRNGINLTGVIDESMMNP